MHSAMLAFIIGAQGGALRLEAEDGRPTDTAFASQGAGFSGKGYVTEFVRDSSRIEWTFTAKGGIYDVRVGYRAAKGPKGFDLSIDGRKMAVMLDASSAFTSKKIGKAELANGSNTVVWERGWGYYDADYIEFTPAAAPPPLVKPSIAPADPRATPEARRLLAYLASQYGKETLSGQYGKDDTAYIAKIAGRQPAIMGGDFMDYSPSRTEFGADPNGLTEKMVEEGRKGRIITMSWHWNAPSGLLNKLSKDDRGNPLDLSWYKGFYSNATTFDAQKALSDPTSEEYELIVRDMDVIAGELRKFAKAKVPVLWRPLHEADGGWFWWGAKGPETYKELWRLMFDRYTKVHGLHNLLWVDSSGGKAEWYPGDDAVDIVGIDMYPSDTHDALTGAWQDLLAQHAGKKLLAISEFGGIPDVERMRRFGVRFSYFVSWSGTQDRYAKSPDEARVLYRAPGVGNKR